MDPTVKVIVDLLTAIATMFGKPILDAALGHHGYVPKRVEEIRPEGHTHTDDAIEELRAKGGENPPTDIPDPHSSPR